MFMLPDIFIFLIFFLFDHLSLRALASHEYLHVRCRGELYITQDMHDMNMNIPSFCPYLYPQNTFGKISQGCHFSDLSLSFFFF